MLLGPGRASASLLQGVPVPTKLRLVASVSPPGTPVTPPVPAGHTIPFGSFPDGFSTSWTFYTLTITVTDGMRTIAVALFFVRRFCWVRRSNLVYCLSNAQSTATA